MADLLGTTEKKSAFNPAQQPKRVGDFNITKMFLTPANVDIINDDEAASGIDLTTVAWHELNLYEDLYSPIVSGDITLTDTIGMIESFPIIGEEKLEISFSTAGATLPPTAVEGGTSDITPAAPPPAEAPKDITNFFRVYKVDPPVQVTDNSRTIKLYFVTETQFTNLLSKVRKCYPTKQTLPNTNQSITDKSYSLADMARDIFYDFFIGAKKPQRQPKAIKPFLIEPTRYQAEMTIPNWTPFKAISFLASKAVSANPNTQGANFVFYQTLQGFRFVSVETLMLGGFRLYNEKFTDVAGLEQEGYGNLKGNALSGSAKENNSSHLPIFDSTTLRDISAEKPFVATYKYMPANMGENKQSSFDSVTEYSLVESFDTMKNLALGMYANRVITHDLIQMKVDRKDFHYVKPSSQIVTVDPITGGITSTINEEEGDPEITQIDASVSTEIGRLCSDKADFLGRPESHISLVPTTLGQGAALRLGPQKEISIVQDNKLQARRQNVKDRTGFAINEDIKENHVEDVLARRISQRLQLDSVRMNFSAPGDSSREVGDLISFDYPSENPTIASSSGSGAGHKYYSGKFLITALRHKITQDEYTMHIEAIKDGYRSAITGGFQVKTPTAQIPDPVTGLTSGVEGSSAIGSDGQIITNPNTGRIVGGL